MIRALVAVTLVCCAVSVATARQNPWAPARKTPDAFDAEWTRLKQGRTYGPEKTGSFSLRYHSSGGEDFENVVEIPREYDPSRKWPLRVQLHGGVGRPGPQAAPPGRPIAQHAPNRIAGEPQIYIYPSGWAEQQWWDSEQVDNIIRVVNEVKERYNVDEARVYLTGISDGGTGVYYIAMKAPTMFAAFLPLNGSIAVLRSPVNGADGEMFGNNLANKPFYIVNGEEDPLYPVYSVEPHVRWFERMGVNLVFRPQPAAGHNTAWWPTEREPYEKFVRDHPRDPHPPKLSWETEDTNFYNRIHWLVITQLGKGSQEYPFEDQGFFLRQKTSGRVDVERSGNTFTARTRGVKQFTLLLSPDVVDFSKPVVVTVNGKDVFKQTVKKDVATLKKWATRDHDRTMLYGVEVTVTVP